MTFSNYYPMPAPRPKIIPRLDQICYIVSLRTWVPVDDMKKRTRKHEIVEARQIAMYLMKIFTSYSLKKIGQFFNGFDHTTVIHSYQTVNNLCDSDPNYREMVKQLESQLENFG